LGNQKDTAFLHQWKLNPFQKFKTLIFWAPSGNQSHGLLDAFPFGSMNFACKDAYYMGFPSNPPCLIDLVGCIVILYPHEIMKFRPILKSKTPLSLF
jgi:hypothetical protein